jgi:hypothetical protein
MRSRFYRRLTPAQAGTGVPGLNREIEPSVTALLRARFIFAALLLMLHWVAPSTGPLDPLPKPSDSVPAFSSGHSVAPAGTLPRATARMQAFEAGTSKPSRSLPQSDGKLDALPQSVRFTGSPASVTAIPIPLVAHCASHTAHDFQARGPPTVAA